MKVCSASHPNGRTGSRQFFCFFVFFVLYFSVTGPACLRHPGFPSCQDSASSFRLRSWPCLPPLGPRYYLGECISATLLALARCLMYRSTIVISIMSIESVSIL